MSLTGTPFLLTTIALAAVAVLLPLAVWSRVRGPALVRGAARLLMVLFAQATAITLVFLLVNNSNNLYDNWGDLLGTGDHVQAAADLGPDGTGGISLRKLSKERQTFRKADGPGMHAAGGVEVTDLRGQVSGVDAEVYVWLPPQYHQKVAKSPTAVDVVYLPRSAGGHNMALWRPQITTVFRWLTQQFDAGGRKATRSTTARPLPHEPSTAGATRAALASGTASRAAAVRRP